MIRDYEKSQHTAIKTSDTSCVCLVFRIQQCCSLEASQWEHIHKLAYVIGGRYPGMVGELSSAERRRQSKTADPVSYERPGPRSPANQKLSICVVSRHPHHSNAGGLTQYVHLWERAAVNMRRGAQPQRVTVLFSNILTALPLYRMVLLLGLVHRLINAIRQWLV